MTKTDKETTETGTKTVGETLESLPSGIIEAPEFVFESYQDGGVVHDPMSITHLYADGFDASPYQFQWMLYTEQEIAHKRYFTMVTKNIHGALGWFKEKAFDPISGQIVFGQEFKKGTPELVLGVRSKAAAQAEQNQMNAFSDRKRNPREELDANVAGMNALLEGTGSGVRDTSKRKEVTWSSSQNK